MVKLPDGTQKRIFGTPEINTKQAAQEEERAHIERVKTEAKHGKKKEVPTLKVWMWGDADPAQPTAEPEGRFWKEWVAVGNKPSEQEAKKSIYRHHLGPALGKLKLDEIGASEVSALRASLVEKDLSRKRVNNILSVLSKILRYAEHVEVIGKVPKIGLLKHQRPEVEWWDFEQYTRLLQAAQDAGDDWFAAVCLAGEAGLRVGEVKGLLWEHVDLIGGTLTVEQQIRHGIVGTPKGGRRRVVPMTATLVRALNQLTAARTGFVVRNPDASSIRDGQATNALRRICRRAGLPSREWHALRHTFGTHLALLGANPFKVQAWMGHAQMTETMRYVHVAHAHPRPLPPALVQAGMGQLDPDHRVLAMLGARGSKVRPARTTGMVLREYKRRGTHVASGAEASVLLQ
jgi:integrase